MTVYEYAKAAVWLAGLATGACALTHGVVQADFSARFGKALSSYDLSVAVHRWPCHFIELFDSIFGRKHLSWYCFRRSCYFSLGAFGTALFTFFSLTTHALPGVDQVTPEHMAMCFMPIVYNLLPDFLSLLETRWLIGWLGRTPSLKKLVGALILDLFLTAAIFLGFATTLLCVAIAYSGPVADVPPGNVFSQSLALSSRVFVTVPSLDALGMFCLAFYTTFLTSVWALMLGGSILAAKTFGLLGGALWRWLAHRFLDMETKPLLSLGWIAGASVLLGALACFPVLLMTGLVQWSAN